MGAKNEWVAQAGAAAFFPQHHRSYEVKRNEQRAQTQPGRRLGAGPLSDLASASSSPAARRHQLPPASPRPRGRVAPGRGLRGPARGRQVAPCPAVDCLPRSRAQRALAASLLQLPLFGPPGRGAPSARTGLTRDVSTATCTSPQMGRALATTSRRRSSSTGASRLRSRRSTFSATRAPASRQMRSRGTLRGPNTPVRTPHGGPPRHPARLDRGTPARKVHCGENLRPIAGGERKTSCSHRKGPPAGRGGREKTSSYRPQSLLCHVLLLQPGLNFPRAPPFTCPGRSEAAPATAATSPPPRRRLCFCASSGARGSAALAAAGSDPSSSSSSSNGNRSSNNCHNHSNSCRYHDNSRRSSGRASSSGSTRSTGDDSPSSRRTAGPRWRSGRRTATPWRRPQQQEQQQQQQQHQQQPRQQRRQRSLPRRPFPQPR